MTSHVEKSPASERLDLPPLTGREGRQFAVDLAPPTMGPHYDPVAFSEIQAAPKNRRAQSSPDFQPPTQATSQFASPIHRPVESVVVGQKKTPSAAAATARLSWPQLIDDLVLANRQLWPDWIATLRDHSTNGTICGVVSTEAGSGASTLACVLTRVWEQYGPALGRRLAEARSGRRDGQTAAGDTALLIDANLARPVLAHRLLTERWPGDRETSWTDWDPQQPRYLIRELPGDESGIRLLPLTCAIRPSAPAGWSSGESQPVPSGQEDSGADSIQYYLPASATVPMVKRLMVNLRQFRSSVPCCVVDLGCLDFWQENQLLPLLAGALDQVILIEPSPVDRRRVSLPFWALKQAGLGNCIVMENPRP